MRNLRATGNEKGQAAVETLFAIPVFLTIFLIGFQLFAITWNAQYTHVRSRYDVLQKANHGACPTSGMDGVWKTGDGTATVSTESIMLPQSSGTRNLKNKSYIVCK